MKYKCRYCKSKSYTNIINLGNQPLSGIFPKINEKDPIRSPLKLIRCKKCDLIQLFDTADINNILNPFSEGLFSSILENIISLLSEEINYIKKNLSNTLKQISFDSDLRKPVLHKLFNLDKSPGFTSFLSNQSEIDNIINKTDIKNLEVICSGVVPPNPSELLSTERMNSFVESVKTKYDIILFDTPPLIAVTDAYVLLRHIKQFILVVRAGITERGALERVLSTSKQQEMKIFGVVMNAMNEEHLYGSSYYYNYYQNYYSEKEE